MARTSLRIPLPTGCSNPARQDVAELLPQLERRAEEARGRGGEKLRERGRRESALLQETLVSQRARVRERA